MVVPAAHCRPPPFSVTVPVPKLLSAAKLIWPPLIVVPPVKVLALVRVSVPVPTLTSEAPLPPFRPPSAIMPAKVVELAVPRVNAVPPSAAVDPATPLRSRMVWLPVPPEISKVAKAPMRLTPLDVAMLPAPERPSVPLAPIVVPPV